VVVSIILLIQKIIQVYKDGKKIPQNFPTSFY
ncbi:unnamed protein product, partial [Litomosoides sigmodontis]